MSTAAIEQLRSQQIEIDQVVLEIQEEFRAEREQVTADTPIPSHALQQRVRLAVTGKFVEKRLPAMWRTYVLRKVFQTLVHLGPLQEVALNPDVSEIMVNNVHDLYVEQKGKIEPIRGAIFHSENDVLRLLEAIATSLRLPLNAENPLMDARLPDGSRVNATVWPVSPWGPTITIRRFGGIPVVMDMLVEWGSASPEVQEYLQAAMERRLNIVVFGGTGSGKTTLLNALSGLIQVDHRIVTVEDVAELQVQRRHVVTLEAKPPDPYGKGEIPLRRLVQNALRMRPDRIIMGECRGGEALDMLQAMNTGHDGSMTTLHANTARDALRRIENMALMAGVDIPLQALREQITSAVQVLVGQKRLPNGKRAITEIAEVHGMEGAVPRLHPIFRYENGRHEQQFRSMFLQAG